MFALDLGDQSADSRDPLEVTFLEPLDHGLLYRAVGVAFGDASLPGDVRVESGETRWVFVPHDAWAAGDYTLVVLPVLEDPSGNRIGRAFEVVSSGAPETDERQPFRLPFRVGAFQSK